MKSRNFFLVVIVAILLSAPLSAVNISGNSSSGTVSAGHSQVSLAPSSTRATMTDTPYGYVVNPFKYYSSEPAPMGIADFGVNGNGAGYTYDTTSFMGIANISVLSVTSSQGNSMSLQLNVNLAFLSSSGQLYVYWIQDVAYITPESNGGSSNVQFIDNIWNMSSTSASIYSSTLSGNGTIYPASTSTGTQYFYYDLPSNSFPGNNVTINYPADVLFKVNSYTATLNGNAVPAVSFMYNDGFGWQTYDNVLFRFASNPQADYGFEVSGSQLNPAQLYYDAEFVMGGPGGGTSAVYGPSTVALNLEYFNGNNYQQITNAYNFGADTGETISSVYASAYYYQDNGQIFMLAGYGRGQLNQSYSSLDTSWIRLQSTIDSGYLYINSTRFTSFSNGLVNVTIAPGTYSLKLLNSSSGAYTFVGNFTVKAGSGLNFIVNSHPVTFISSGLPVGSSWSVTMDNQTQATTGTSVLFYILPGENYTYSVSSGVRYIPDPDAGSITGTNTSMTVSIQWTPMIFQMNFTESGLQAGMHWSIDVDGVSVSSSSPQISVSRPTGTYSFSVSQISGYIAYPSSGSVYLQNNTTISVIYAVASGNGSEMVSGTLLLNNGTLVNGEYYNLLEPHIKPMQVLYDQSNGYLYVAGSGSSQILVVNTINDSLEGVMQLGQGVYPALLAYNQYNGLIYATTDSGSLIALSPSTESIIGTIYTGITGNITAISADSSNGNILLTWGSNFTIVEHGGLLGQSVDIGTGDVIQAASYEPGTSTLMAAYRNSTGNYYLITVDTLTMKINGTLSLSSLSGVSSIMFGTSGGRAYVSGTGGIEVVNTTSLSSSAFIPIDGIALYSAVDPLTHEIYVTTEPYPHGATHYNLAVINELNSTVTRETPLPTGSLFVSYSQKSEQVFVSNPQADSLYIYQPDYYYPVVFVESGLPSGTAWYVHINGANYSSSDGANITAYLPGGVYNYTTGNEAGYTSSSATGTVDVPASTVGIAFSPAGSSGVNPIPIMDYIIFAIALAAVSAAGFAYMRKRKR